MPRLTMTSNLCDFLEQALVLASRYMLALAKEPIHVRELWINYNPSTKNVFLIDSEFNIYVLRRKNRTDKICKLESEKNE